MDLDILSESLYNSDMPTIDLTRSPDLAVSVGGSVHPHERHRVTATASGELRIPTSPPARGFTVELVGDRSLTLALTLDQLRLLHLVVDDFLHDR
jgi:hypothetical protein